jgi:hypothetical protein
VAQDASRVIRALEIAGNLGFSGNIEHGPGHQATDIPSMFTGAIPTGTASN